MQAAQGFIIRGLLGFGLPRGAGLLKVLAPLLCSKEEVLMPIAFLALRSHLRTLAKVWLSLNPHPDDIHGLLVQLVNQVIVLLLETLPLDHSPHQLHLQPFIGTLRTSQLLFQLILLLPLSHDLLTELLLLLDKFDLELPLKVGDAHIPLHLLLLPLLAKVFVEICAFMLQIYDFLISQVKFMLNQGKLTRKLVWTAEVRGVVARVCILF